MIILIFIFIMLFVGLYYNINRVKVLEEFKISDNVKYIINYTTERCNSNEETQINFFDKNGKLISMFYDKSASSYTSLDKIDGNKYSFFTLDNIWFSDGTKLENDEMKTKYKFANKNGMDTVYESGKIEKINMFYKAVSHGLSYEQKELGDIDVLEFFDSKRLYNVPIKICGMIVVDQQKGLLYSLYDLQSNQIFAQTIEYNRQKDKFNTMNFSIDINAFCKEMNYDSDERSMVLDNVVYANNRVYAVLSVGEVDFEQYILEFDSYTNSNLLKYRAYYKLEKPEKYAIRYGTIGKVDNNIIKYYSEYNPNYLLTFDTKSHEIKTYSFLDEFSDEERKETILKAINNELYLLTKYEKQFVLRKVIDNNKVKVVMKFDIPKSLLKDKQNSPVGFYIVD